jgi:hypothetical protein
VLEEGKISNKQMKLILGEIEGQGGEASGNDLHSGGMRGEGIGFFCGLRHVSRETAPSKQEEPPLGGSWRRSIFSCLGSKL